MGRLHIGIYAFALILFGLLCLLVRQFLYLPGDITISLWLQRIIPSSIDPVLQAISYINSALPAFVIVTLLVGSLWVLGKRLEPVFIVVLTSSAALLNWLIKLLVSQPRPNSDFIQLFAESNGFSFPSGHVTHAIVFYGFLIYLVPRLVKLSAVAKTLQLLLELVIFLTAVSRLYLGAHWASDVLGSLFLGGLMLIPAIILYRNFTPDIRNYTSDVEEYPVEEPLEERNA